MTGKRTAFMALTLSLCAVSVFYIVSAAGNAPGSEADPVVTRSYVDKKINDTLMQLNGAGGGVSGAIGSDELIAQIEYIVRTQVQKAEGTAFTPVSVEMGSTIYGGEGCEMILRSGLGYIVTSTDGVVNATTGADLTNGAQAPKNNLLLIPRDDGRGVKAADACWFMVKGNYTIR